MIKRQEEIKGDDLSEVNLLTSPCIKSSLNSIILKEIPEKLKRYAFR